MFEKEEESYESYRLNSLNNSKDQIKYLKKCKIPKWNLILNNENLYEDTIEFYIDKFSINKLSEVRLSSVFIEKHIDKLDLKILQRNNILSEEFIRKHEDELIIDLIIKKQRISERYITELMNKFDYINKIDVVTNQILSEDFLENNQKMIKFSLESQILSEKFMEKYMDKLMNKSLILKHKNISEEFIQKNIKNFSINDLIYYKKLNQSFINKNIELIKEEECMIHLIKKQRLSEEFINKYNNEFDQSEWNELMLNQKLSEDFIEKNHSKINWLSLSKNVVIDEKIIEKYKDELSFGVVLENRKLSKSFWDKNEEISDSNIILMTEHQYCSDKFLERNIEEIKDWQLNISGNKKIKITYLSENSIKKYKKELNMFIVISNNLLSEKFIEKEIVKMGLWYEISKYQKLSEEFIEKYYDKINFNFLVQNTKIKIKTMKSFINNVNVNTLKRQNTKINLKYRQKENEKNFRIYKMFNCDEGLMNKKGLYVNREVKENTEKFKKIGKDVLSNLYIERNMNHVENKIIREEKREEIRDKRKMILRNRKSKKIKKENKKRCLSEIKEKRIEDENQEIVF